MAQRPLLFLDTSVILSAVFSSTGGSQAILEFAKEGLLQIVITDMVVTEARRKLTQRYGPKERDKLRTILLNLKPGIKATPTNEEIRQFDESITDKNDRHVLAGAKKHNATVLITLDRRHFFTENITSAKLPFKIQFPGDFLSDYRTKHIRKQNF